MTLPFLTVATTPSKVGHGLIEHIVRILCVSVVVIAYFPILRESSDLGKTLFVSALDAGQYIIFETSMMRYEVATA
jgi:hypothetical protein